MGKFVKVSILKCAQCDLMQWILSMAVGNAEPPPWVSTPPAPHLSHCCLSPLPLPPWGVRDMSWALELKNLQTVPWASRRALQQATDGGKQVEEMCPCGQGGPQPISHANTEVMVRKLLTMDTDNHRLMFLLGPQPLCWHYLNGEKTVQSPNEQLI